MNEDEETPMTMPREDLCELAWSRPMLQLAKDFGISDVALAKRWRRLATPVPAWTLSAFSRRMDLELLSKPEQSLQSRLTATQALPSRDLRSERARYVLRVQSNATRNTAVAGQLVRMQHLLKMWLECDMTRFSRS